MKLSSTLGCSCALFVMASAGSGAAIPVNAGESIQAAIDGAGPGDVIIVEPGVYFETIDLSGKSLILRGRVGPGRTIIDAAGADSVIRCVGGESAETLIAGLTLRGGNAVIGGGLRIQDSSPTVAQCIIEDNVGTIGGGVLIGGDSSPLICEVEIRNNTADFGGGIAMRDGAVPIVMGCTIEGNAANFGGGAENRNSASPRFVACTFVQNNATTGSGGGMYTNGSLPKVIACRFEQNTSATRSGGAMFNVDSDSRVSSCVFVGNTALENGGAVYNDGGAPQFSSCLFNDNGALFGGGMYSTGGGMVDVVNCTFVFNQAGSTGGAILSLFGSTSLVRNSIAWLNGPDPIADFRTASTVSSSCVQGGWSGAGTGNITDEPRFVNMKQGDFRILSTSPCLDAGDQAELLPDVDDADEDGDTLEMTPLDLVGQPRVMYDGVDMGAHESTTAFCGVDISSDGVIGFVDLVDLLSVWGPCDGECPADFDGDGMVGVADLALLLPAWGDCAS